MKIPSNADKYNLKAYGFLNISDREPGVFLMEKRHKRAGLCFRNINIIHTKYMPKKCMQKQSVLQYINRHVGVIQGSKYTG